MKFIHKLFGLLATTWKNGWSVHKFFFAKFMNTPPTLKKLPGLSAGTQQDGRYVLEIASRFLTHNKTPYKVFVYILLVSLVVGCQAPLTSTPTPGLGLASLTWTLWPLDVIMVLSTTSLKTTPTGTETLEGRAAEVYQVSGNVSDDPTGMIASLGQPISRSDGTVWVDQETGALLKLQIDCETDVKDASGTVRGRSPGSLQISVTQIGRVRVEMK